MVYHPAYSWTDPQVETLTKLCADGHSSSQIAGVLGAGVTRNAVIGKCHRLGLTLRGGKNQYEGKHSSPTKVRLGTRMPPWVPTGTGRREGKSPAVPLPPPIAMPIVSDWTGIAAEVSEIQPMECRWPMGETLQPATGFCRAPVIGVAKPYCIYHTHVSTNGTPTEGKQE